VPGCFWFQVLVPPLAEASVETGIARGLPAAAVGWLGKKGGRGVWSGNAAGPLPLPRCAGWSAGRRVLWPRSGVSKRPRGRERKRFRLEVEVSDYQ